MNRFLGLLSLLVLSAVVAPAQEPPRVSVPDLNARATFLAKPTYPDDPALLVADGTTIILKVVVDASGNVRSAQCSSTCPPSLKEAFEKAALESKFAPLIVRGDAVIYEGTLLYPVAFERIDWYMFGTALESVHSFDNISVEPVAARLTGQWGDERSRLRTVDSEKDINVRIKTLAEMIDHFRRKLKGKDQWLFSTGVALRRVTIWTQAGGPVDREELRAGIEALSPVADGAPADIPKEFLTAIKALSEYKIKPEASDKDLRTDIRAYAFNLRDYPK